MLQKQENHTLTPPERSMREFRRRESNQQVNVRFGRVSSGHGTLDQLLTLVRILHGSLEFAPPVHTLYGLWKGIQLCPWGHAVDLGFGSMQVILSQCKRSRSLDHMVLIGFILYSMYFSPSILFILFLKQIFLEKPKRHFSLTNNKNITLGKLTKKRRQENIEISLI